jgi:BlaI family transcriptional regulator, penicillinase repressor
MCRNMGKASIHRVGDLQLHILRILWDRGEATVADVLENLSGTELAYTTVATMLRKMEGRGLVTHRADGRSFVYRPKVKAEDISHRMANQLVDRLFEGSLLDAVNHLLTTREVSREELAKIEQLIAEKKKAK